MDKNQESQAPNTNERHRIREPEKPEINVSSKKEPKSYKIVCKLVMRKYGYCVLRSLGNASESVVQIAESLVRSGCARIEKIESAVTEVDDLNNETGTRQGISFVVRLEKGPKFDEMTMNLE